MNGRTIAFSLLLTGTFVACQPSETHEKEAGQAPDAVYGQTVESALAKYTTVELAADLSALTAKQRQMIPLLIEAAEAMDDAFWQQAYGDKDALLSSIENEDARRFVEINYGPWDRLADNKPFVDGVGEKPRGANFYPPDMSKEEFEEAAETAPELLSLYTVVERDSEGELTAVPYSRIYSDLYALAAEKLRAASELAEDPGLKNYLTLRAAALLSDEYYESDVAWMDMKSNVLDIVIGPIENYEDSLFNYKAANEAYVLVKDQAWSARLTKYAEMLPILQAGLPVPAEYKEESPGTESDLGAYDVLYYAGDCNAGSKTIAINLPNDEQVQLLKGSRRLQLKNAMRAKFEQILLPIAGVLIDSEQRTSINFDAFFENTMFHEVAHGLGIKNTITGIGTVRSALKDHASALEEGKADVLGLYMVTELHERGDLDDDEINDNYVTFMASIFRSIRFGASSAHGVANMIRFNFFEEMGAFSRDDSGVYRVDFDQLKLAADALSEKILRLQGEGDYESVGAFVDRYGRIEETLQRDLQRLADAGIPVDIVFEQGVAALGLDT